MKYWQWSYIMAMLCMICYYLSDKEFMPLILAYIFIVVGAITFIFRNNLNE